MATRKRQNGVLVLTALSCILTLPVLRSEVRFKPLTPNDLQRRREVSPLKIKIPSKKISVGSFAQRDLMPGLKG
jgi:hypothetical protein